LVKKLDRSFTKEDWRGVINLVVGVGKDKDKAFARKFDEALESHATREHTIGLENLRIPFPDPKSMSPRKEFIVRAACRAYIQLGDARNGGKWCDTLLGMPGIEEDEDGLVGKGESWLLKVEWDEAVRVLDKAFDASGRSSRDVSVAFILALNM
jgi:DnaJ family protein C protein 3